MRVLVAMVGLGAFFCYTMSRSTTGDVRESAESAAEKVVLGQRGAKPVIAARSSVPWINRTISVPSFWVPTEIANVEYGDPRVSLCRIDWNRYWRNPSRTPMFRDLVGMSRCGRGKSGSLNVLVADLAKRRVKPVPPTGFVFHESRVGSTLIANMLGSIPTNLVYSESAPPATIINHCRKCTPEERSSLLQKMVALMGASPFHERLYFKFQSITVPNIAVLSAAFPDTPWIFVYREPVQVMMSHFKRGGSGSPPCLREHRRPREETADILGVSQRMATEESKERFCAAHLSMLCAAALASDQASGDRALMVNYDSLPGSLVHYVIPTHFGVSPFDQLDAQRMIDTSNVYSKRRKALPPGGDVASVKKWEGDSEAKEQAASEEVREAAAVIMRPFFEKLLAATVAKTNGDDLIRFKNQTLLSYY